MEALISLATVFLLMSIYSTKVVFIRRKEYINIHNSSPQLARKTLSNLLFAVVAVVVSMTCGVTCLAGIAIVVALG